MNKEPRDKTFDNEVQSNKRKRGLKPRSKRNRKRPRGGVGVLNIYNEDDEEGDTCAYEVQIDILPLEINQRKETDHQQSTKDKRRIRVVRPYPFTYATFSKARWTNRTLLEVYCTEFGSYPKSYYEEAIRNGRITVSGKKVEVDYKVKGGDELCHVVHRHEPAVAICEDTVEDSDENIIFTSSSKSLKATTPCVRIIHEDEDLIVVDKPSTVPVHP